MGKEDIERLGFSVVATTTFADSVSYDAHYVRGVRFMVRGSKAETPERAMDALYTACVVKLLKKGI